MAVPQHRGTHSPSAHRVWIKRLACALLGASLALPATAQTVAPTLELQVKAAFLYNFAKFVTWPPDARLPPDAPFVIGVSGDDAFAGALEQAVRDKSVEGHPFEVRRVQRPEEMARCQVAYLAAGDADRLDALLRTIGRAPVLTIG